MNPSDTPRTDAAFTSICHRIDTDGYTYREDHVSASFARQLERELNSHSASAKLLPELAHASEDLLASVLRFNSADNDQIERLQAAILEAEKILKP